MNDPKLQSSLLRDASDERIAALGDRTFNLLVQKEARRLATDYAYNPTTFLWTEPDDKLCQLCYQWRRYPVGQRHFGYAWWKICHRDTCSCAHHDGELWLAATA